MANIPIIPKDRLDAQLKDYLYRQTNYAIMLTGSWGAGKTFYLKNVFFKNLDETGYKGIIISLFGVKSIDDVKDRIFLELYPILNNKVLKTSTTIFKSLIKSIDLTKIITKDGIVTSAIENIEKMSQELSEQKREFINLDKLLICFDDLERANPEMLSDNQILGYINSLVEDNNVKVIVIANEGKLPEQTFRKVKEKVIGTTIHFAQEFDSAFESILCSLQNPTDKFLTHVRESKTAIFNFLKNENGENINYRTLAYFLNYYYPICHHIQCGFKVKDLDDQKDNILDVLLKFSLMVCIEYKKGIIDFRAKHGLENGVDYMIRKIYPIGDDKTKSIGEELIDKYFPDDGYMYYESIYAYLTGGDYFDQVKFYTELCNNYHVVDQNISPQYKIYNKLSAYAYQQMSDQEFIDETRKLRDYAISGQFFLQDYPTIFYFIIRHGNVLNINYQTLLNKFKKAIRKTIVFHKYTPGLNRYMTVGKDHEYYEYYSQLYPIMTEVNLLAKTVSERKLDIQIENDLQKDYQKLHTWMVQEYQNPSLNASLSGIRPKIFFNTFLKASNSQKVQMNLLIMITYSPVLYDAVKSDFDFLSNLLKLVTAYLDKKSVKNISGNLILELQENLKKTLIDRKGLIGEPL